MDLNKLENDEFGFTLLMRTFVEELGELEVTILRCC